MWILFKCTFWMCHQVCIILMQHSVCCVPFGLCRTFWMLGVRCQTLDSGRLLKSSGDRCFFANLSDSCDPHIEPSWLIKLMVAENTVSGRLVPNVFNECYVLSTSVKDVFTHVHLFVGWLVCQQEEQVWFLQQLLFNVFVVHSVIISYYSSFHC